MHRSGDLGRTRLTRRQFNALAGSTLASLALAQRSAAAPHPRTADLPLAYAADRQTSPVALIGVPRTSDDLAVETAVQRAALAVTDFSWLSRGDQVLIKPVCNSGNDYPATTDPVALRAMIRLLKEKGAGRVVVGDMSGVQFVRFSKDRLTGSTRELMNRNGLLRSIEAAGGELAAFEEAGWDAFYDERPRASTSWRQPLLLPRVLRDVDHVVLMPRCSRHLLAGSTLGLKAAVGWWRHDSRLEYHHDAASFAQKTAESNTVPSLLDKQRLVLTSATKVLTTFGPDEGHVVAPDTGLIIASASVLAHDMVSLAWLLRTRATVPADLKDGIMEDPNQSGLFVNLANRVVSHWLGGFGAALTTERLIPYELATVWDDQVLRFGAAAFGGVPRVDLVDAEHSVPEPLRNALQAEIALPDSVATGGA